MEASTNFLFRIVSLLPFAVLFFDHYILLHIVVDMRLNGACPAGVGALLGRFQMTEGPCKPSQLSVHFTSEGSTLSGCDIELLGTGYRLSLIKKRFAAGQYTKCVTCLFL